LVALSEIDSQDRLYGRFLGQTHKIHGGRSVVDIGQSEGTDPVRLGQFQQFDLGKGPVVQGMVCVAVQVHHCFLWANRIGGCPSKGLEPRPMVRAPRAEARIRLDSPNLLRTRSMARYRANRFSLSSNRSIW